MPDVSNEKQRAFDDALAALPPKRRKFVLEYLHDLHGQNAAIRAGYSAETARSQASRMLTFVDIAHAVTLGMQLCAMPADEVLARIADHARGSMSDFLDEAGDIDLSRARARGKLHLVKSRSVSKEGERIELYDGQAALALLAKIAGLVTDKVEHSGEIAGKVYAGFDPDKV